MHLALILELLVDRLELATEILEFAILLVRFLLELKDLRTKLWPEYFGQCGPKRQPV